MLAAEKWTKGACQIQSQRGTRRLPSSSTSYVTTLIGSSKGRILDAKSPPLVSLSRDSTSRRHNATEDAVTLLHSPRHQPSPASCSLTPACAAPIFPDVLSLNTGDGTDLGYFSVPLAVPFSCNPQRAKANPSSRVQTENPTRHTRSGITGCAGTWCFCFPAAPSSSPTHPKAHAKDQHFRGRLYCEELC
jgi:hypothetical protein